MTKLNGKKIIQSIDVPDRSRRLSFDVNAACAGFLRSRGLCSLDFNFATQTNRQAKARVVTIRRADLSRFSKTQPGRNT